MTDISQKAAETLFYLHKLFTPEPLSPIFKQGGPFEGWNEDLTQIAVFIICFFIVDNLFVKPFILPKARYFVLHAMANAVVVFTSLPDLYKAVTRHPYDTLNFPAFTVLGNSATVALHLYHILAFPMTKDDWWHHLQFIPMCAFAVTFKQTVGCAVALSNFFLSGLPGGLEYIFLTLVIHGKMKKKTEKEYFAWLNVWVRGPGAIWTTVLGYFAWREGQLAQGDFPTILAWTCGGFHIYNGMYFNMIAVESCARYMYNMKLERERKEEEEKKRSVMSPTVNPGKALPDF